jgi:Protein of Unknown function (DUF2784)
MAQPWIHGFWFFATVAVLGAHLLFNVWYVFGAAVTKGRPRWELLHLISLVYGVIAENAKFACPLTLLEKWCELRAGLIPFEGPFDLYYLRALVSPHFPKWLLGYGAVGVFLVNVAIYIRRYALSQAHAHRATH